MTLKAVYDYTRPSPQHFRRTTLSSIQEVNGQSVPEGTVAFRIRQLQQLASQLPDSTLLPLPERDRDGESLGWGRRVEGQVRLIQPASHISSIELNHAVPRPVVSSHLRRPGNLTGIPEPASHCPASQKPSLKVRHSRSMMDQVSSLDSLPSTPNSRRQDARQILQEHRVSLPPG
jgi:hypothetical protein